eukprot:403339434
MKQSSMKQCMFMLAFALLVCQSIAFELDLNSMHQQIKERVGQVKSLPHQVKAYSNDEFTWSLDVPRILFQYIITAVFCPLFILPSIFLNNQELFTAVLYKFVYAPYIRLSGFDK